MSRALIVIDVQKSFLEDPLWAATSQPDIAGQVGRLVDAARAADELVVWILHAEPGSGGAFDPANGLVALIEPLAPADGEQVLIKAMHNAFTTTRLQLLLVENGITEVVVCGIRTEQCVETTARLACDLGYGVFFVLDASATTPREHWEAPEGRSLAEVLADPLTLGTAAIDERVAYALAGRFAQVVTVDQLVGARV